MNLLKRNKFKFGALVILCALYLYHFYWGQYIQFTEQVELSNGEIIIVKRKLKTNSFGEVGGPGGWEVKFNSLKIERPIKDDDPSIWETNEEELPILFEFDSKAKQWLIVASVTCRVWKDFGQPNDNYHYVEYRYVDGQWQRGKLSITLIGRTANVLYGINARGEHSTVSIPSKFLRMNEPGTIERYIKIAPSTVRC